MHQSLTEELITMAAADQSMREAYTRGEEWDAAVDAANEQRMIEIVSQEGWPSIQKVGSKASHAAWLLVQHAPDTAFMQRCLALMEALPKGAVNPANIAYLKDRIMMRRGEPQLYGTQFQRIDGDIQHWPIQDPGHVDKLRASVGLNTFAAYEAQLREHFEEEKLKT